MYCRGLLVASLVLAVSAPVFGQKFGSGFNNGRNGPGNQGQQPPPPTTQEGTVERVDRGGIVMSIKGGQTMTVMVSATTKVHLTGSASVNFIKPGVAVEFTAEVDAKKGVKEKLTLLTVVALTTEHPAGLFPEGSTSASSAEPDNFGFAAGGGGNAAPAEKGAKKAEKHKAASAIKLPATVVVRGTVRSCKAGKLMVKIDKGTVHADLADDAQVTVDTADYTRATKGDAITARGIAAQRGVQILMQAESVTITAAEPLSGGAKKKTAKVDKKQGRAKDDSGDDAADLKGGKKADAN